MFRRALVASVVLVACGGGGGGDDDVPDAPTSAACMEATTFQDITNIEDKIFKQSCIFSGCHNGANTPAGMIDLRTGAAHDHLVGVQSAIDTSRMLVVPGDAKKSYLLMMLGQVAPADADPPASPPPSDIGFMPQGTGNILLCPEKRGAIERWIVAGAPAT
jgi:hypothetical protein